MRGYGDHEAMIASSKTYNKAITEIKAVWRDAFGEELRVAGDQPSQRFKNMTEELRRIFVDRAYKQKFIEALDMDILGGKDATVEDVVKSVANDSVLRSVDDLTPNQILVAIETVALECGSDEELVEVNLANFLRLVVKNIFLENDINGRINIGANKHFPRLYQWLTEYAETTEWPGGTGLKVRNLSGKGRVAKRPADPKLLKVVINHQYL